MSYLQCSDTVCWVTERALANKKTCASYPQRFSSRTRTSGCRSKSLSLLVTLESTLHAFISYHLLSPVTFSSSPLLLCLSITLSLFHAWLKTYLFHKTSPPVVSLFSPGLPLWTSARTVTSQRISFCFQFFLNFFF